jgi:hypothetical protein
MTTISADGSGVDAVLRGDLAGILALGGERKQPAVCDGGLQVTLVAGTRNHLYRTMTGIRSRKDLGTAPPAAVDGAEGLRQKNRA